MLIKPQNIRVEESVEDLGAREMQNICVVGYSELLDCRSFTKKEAFHILSTALFVIMRRETLSTS